MEFTEKQKQLAKFITENGGWKSNMLFVEVYGYVGNEINAIKFDLSKPKGNGIVLSKEQYLDWYYLDEKENQLEHNHNNTHATKQSDGSIEQIIKEYFEIKETIETKQKELDVLKDSLDTKYNELVEKGKNLNVSISIIDNTETTKTEELVITDWRDLKVGDIIWWSGDDRENKAGEYEVEELEDKNYYKGDFAIYLDKNIWVDMVKEQWRFVSRPS